MKSDYVESSIIHEITREHGKEIKQEVGFPCQNGANRDHVKGVINTISNNISIIVNGKWP